MKYTHYIWDFDGTICDSYHHGAQAFLEALRRDGRKDLPPLEEVFLWLQIRWDTTKEHYGMSDEAYAMYWQLETDFSTAPTPTLLPHIRETLEAIVAQGGKNYLYTLRDHVAVEFLQQEGLYPLFTECVTHENGFPPKPSPDAVRYLMEKYQLDPAQTIMIGDRDIDGQCGILAGTNGCLMTYLEKNAYGESLMDTTAMPWKCIGAANFRTLMEI